MSLPAHAEHRRLVDPVEAFKLRCWARARLYADGELQLHDAVDVLQEFAERLGLVDADAVQAEMACAFEPVRAADDVDNVDVTEAAEPADDQQADDVVGTDTDDEYDGISSSFAAACRKADAKIGERFELDDIPPGVASAARLQRDYQDTIRRQRERYGAPEASLQAAEYLISEHDPKRFDAWMAGRNARERAAIYRGLDQHKAERERAKAFNKETNGKAEVT